MAWGQSSLAERIQQLRRDWSESDTAEAPAAQPRPDATTPRRAPSALPQINARSLLPTNLFGRPGTNSSDTSRDAAGSQPRAGTASSADLSTSQRVATPTRRTVAPRAGSVAAEDSGDGGDSLADGFTLPGLGRPRSTGSRSGSRAYDASSGTSSSLSRAMGTDRAAAKVASRPRNELPGKSPANLPANRSPANAVRRSPTTGHDKDFDPELLRNELAGAFPVPVDGDNKETSDDNTPTPANGWESGDHDAPRSRHDRGSVEEPVMPLATEPISLPTRSEPVEAVPAPRNTPRRIDPLGRTSAAAGAAINAESTIRAAEANDAAAKAFGPDRSTTAGELPDDNSASTTSILPYDGPGAVGRETFADGQPAARPGSAVLVANQAPIITSDIRGPKQIMIGREATYRVRLQNQGTVAAEELLASVRIPSWAEVVDTTATRGIVRHAEGTDAITALEWQIPRLDAGASQTLHLRLVPRNSRPLELDVTWTHAPVASRAVVEVQEPKLEMHVSGPDDVLFDKAYVYRLNLSNPGTGTAEDVRIDLMPLGGGERPVSTQRLGNLAPGANKSVEVELTAREAGKLSVHAVATAEGGLKSEASREIFCRKPELAVDWRGPTMQYAGTTATYFFRVRNPGTASADDVVVRVALPAGAQFVGASEGHVHDPTSGEVAWRVGSLGPGDDCYMELRCQVHTPGENRMQITAATAAGDLSDVEAAATDVVALADLTLDVSDPAGPVLVGDDAVYEIRIENRGASAAEDVNVVALFSAGLEPQTVEGASYNVADGRVSFRTIRKLPAGQQAVLRIRARALKPGTHVFRAEVLCRDLEIKLAAEETTRFYDNAVGHEPNSNMPTSVGGRYGESLR